MNTNKIFYTDDGSQSIRSLTYDVPYHSKHGAVQESMHVFIDAGLRALPPSTLPIQIFEMGFGTGLNAYLALLETYGDTPAIHYTTIEAYPLNNAVVQQLEYPKHLNQSDRDVFERLHAAPWDEAFQPITPQFQIKKIQAKIEDYTFAKSALTDLVFFDAFAPNAQPELWEAPVMEKIFGLLKPGGILTTYCAQGAFKRTLKALGFQVEALPGPPGKREMTRARKML